MNLSPLNCSVKMSPMRKRVTLTVKEQKRLKVIMDLEAGRMTGREAAVVLGLSLRQVRRLTAAFRKEGAAGLAHGNRGRPSVHRLPEEVRDLILALARNTYPDYNDTHFTEKLGQQHDIVVSRSTVRRLRRSIGQGSPRKRRPPRHRSRRERYPLPGMLLQIDGSHHDWLEGRGPPLVLIAAIDDATNEVPYALFRHQEDAAGYFELILAISQSHGLPAAVYADRHTIFQSPAKATIEQQLSGELPRSQFGRLMHDLAVESIPARSPQAKGRVERLFGTLQDRLVKELREAHASSLEDANRVLWSYLPSFNARFALPAPRDGSAYRPWPVDLIPEHAFSFKHRRTVANDNTISFDGKRLQIPPGPKRISYVRARVDVLQYLDGRLGIAYQGETLIIYQPATRDPVRIGKFTPAALPEPSPPESEPSQLAPSPKPRKPYKPAPDHPWRRYAVTQRAE
jgi:transposase